MNVTLIFLWENLHGHFEGNLCLMYVVAILLFLNIFIELGKDSFDCSNGICSNDITLAYWYSFWDNVSAQLEKKKTPPSFAIKNTIFKYYVSKAKNKRILRSIS